MAVHVQALIPSLRTDGVCWFLLWAAPSLGSGGVASRSPQCSGSRTRIRWGCMQRLPVGSGKWDKYEDPAQRAAAEARIAQHQRSNSGECSTVRQQPSAPTSPLMYTVQLSAKRLTFSFAEPAANISLFSARQQETENCPYPVAKK